jgi:hypothetical protein
MEPYAFLREHVRKATSVLDLLRRALRSDVGRGGVNWGKQKPKLVYFNRELLVQAYALAGGLPESQGSQLVSDSAEAT